MIINQRTLRRIKQTGLNIIVSLNAKEWHHFTVTGVTGPSLID